jgi:hypothetical protein
VQPSKQGYIALSFKTGSTAFATKGEQTLLTISDTAGASYYLRIGISNAGLLFVEHKDGGSLYKFSAKEALAVSTIYTAIIDSNESSLSIKINGLYQSITTIATDNGKWVSYITGRDNITIGCLKINAESQYFEGSVFELIISHKYQSSMSVTNDIDTHLAADSGASIVFPVLNNADNHLTIPTYDGSSSLVHPDVVDFGVAWNGYRYWMAMTPYPDSSAALENPSIVASNDGDTWVVPAGLVNPITAAPGTGHLADTALVFDGTYLNCYYINPILGKTYVKKSSDGVTWGAEEELASVNSTSPTVIKVGSTWHMWHQQGAAGSEVIKYRAGTNYKTFGVVQSVTTTGLDYLPWHLCVVNNPVNSNYWMLLSAYKAGLTQGMDDDLYLLVGSDEKTFTPYDAKPILRKRGRGWDGKAIYRASLVIRADGTITIWYSANGYVEDDWFVGRIDTTVTEIKTALSIP